MECSEDSDQYFFRDYLSLYSSKFSLDDQALSTRTFGQDF